MWPVRPGRGLGRERWAGWPADEGKTMAQIECGHCGQVHQVRDEALEKFAGREIPCQKCGKRFTVQVRRKAEPVAEADDETAEEFDMSETAGRMPERAGAGVAASGGRVSSARRNVPRPSRPRLVEMAQRLRGQARRVKILGLVGIGGGMVWAAVSAANGGVNAAASVGLGLLVGCAWFAVAAVIANRLELQAETIEVTVNSELLLWHMVAG